MPIDLCCALSWVPMDVFQECDRGLIDCLKSEIVQLRVQLKTLLADARMSGGMGAVSSQLALLGGGIATIPCPETLLFGGAMMTGCALTTVSGFVNAREKTVAHRHAVQELADLERELRQVIGNAMAHDLCLRAYLEEEAGIAYADMD